VLIICVLTDFFLSLPLVPQGLNVFSLAKIFIPVLNDDNWGLIVVTMQSLRGQKGCGSMVFKDFGGAGLDTTKQQQMVFVKDWLQREADKHSSPFDSMGWSLMVEEAMACDVGDGAILLFAHIEFMKLDLPICFGADDIDHFRYRFSLQVFTSIDKID